MTVNSWAFLFFFTVIFAVYYLPAVSRRPRVQNLWLLLGSFVFYGFVDWRAIPLLAGAIVAFYFLGLQVQKAADGDKWQQASYLRATGVGLGIGILLGFKYLGFFASLFASVGVSFYTFRMMGYLIDIYRGKTDAERDFVNFALYVSFFPTLLSGPIDRAGRFLPQLENGRQFNYETATDGFLQVLWGMFIKMCVADNLAPFTDYAWNHIGEAGGISLAFSALVYPLQLYADFDGYSHMAIGVAKLLGIKVARNFDHPLLARNIAEYWRRWHMSLTSWLTDYVFTPLSISLRKLGKTGSCIAIVLTFVLIGLWHGANWTFALFGLYHGILFIPLVYAGAFQKRKKLEAGRWGLPRLGDVALMVLTYLLVAVGLILFRAPSVGNALSFVSGMFHAGSWHLSTLHSDLWLAGFSVIAPLPVALIPILEWVRRGKEYPVQPGWLSPTLRNSAVHCLLITVLIIAIVLFQGHTGSFVYFNF